MYVCGRTGNCDSYVTAAVCCILFSDIKVKIEFFLQKERKAETET